MMLHTFSTLGCPEMNLDEAIALSARHGLHSLELRTLNNTTDLPAWFQEHYGTPAGLAAHLKQRRMKVCSIGTSFKLIGSDDIDRVQLINFVRWADEANVPWLRVFDGGKHGDEAEIAEVAETLAWWRAERLKNNWVTDLMLETHDSMLTSDRLRALISKCPRISILWDTHHTWKRGGEAPAVTWKALRNHTIHLHVKDSVSKPTPNGSHPYTYVMPGDGEYPMKDLLNALKTDKYNGIMSFEWERMWHPYLPELDKALYHAKQTQWW